MKYHIIFTNQKTLPWQVVTNTGQAIACFNREFMAINCCKLMNEESFEIE